MRELSDEELIDLVEDLKGDSEYREEYQTEFRWINQRNQPVDHKIFSPTPLARILSKEKSRKITANLRLLEPLIREGLDIQQDGFLRLLIGSDWWKSLSLPSLEFVDDVEAYAEQILPEIKERIDLLMYSMHNFGRVKGKALHLVSNPYFLLTERETVGVYQGVLTNGLFDRDNGRKAGIITRHMYGQLLGYCPEEVLARTKKRDFRHHSLGHMLQSEFNDSVQDAVRNAYPQSKYPNLYEDSDKKQNGKPNFGGLSDLVDSLDALFSRGEN